MSVGQGTGTATVNSQVHPSKQSLIGFGADRFVRQTHANYPYASSTGHQLGGLSLVERATNNIDAHTYTHLFPENRSRAMESIDGHLYTHSLTELLSSLLVSDDSATKCKGAAVGGSAKSNIEQRLTEKIWLGMHRKGDYCVRACVCLWVAMETSETHHRPVPKIPAVGCDPQHETTKPLPTMAAIVIDIEKYINACLCVCVLVYKTGDGRLAH